LIRFETSIVIDRPSEDVFRFVADSRNNALWNSAVVDVTRISDERERVGSKYLMRRNLTKGPAKNIYEIIEYDPNSKFSIKTISGPTPFVYRYSFEPKDRGTKLELSAEAETRGLIEELGSASRLLPDWILARLVKRGVDANLRTLKDLLERRS